MLERLRELIPLDTRVTVLADRGFGDRDLYFTIGELGSKNLRFGLASTRTNDPRRRDRMLMLSACAQALLTLLGAAAEEVGLDRTMKASTTKKRTHSLFRQGLH